ncbi:MAG: hypothetical protein V1873_05525 [Verrucomicrobiota bacterium]
MKKPRSRNRPPFVGTRERTIKPGGWLVIPAEYRALLQGRRGVIRVLVVKGKPANLSCYRFEDWALARRELMALGGDVRRGREAALGSSPLITACALDSQGRIRLPDGFRQHADLDHRVVIVGCFDSFELWRPHRWKRHTATTQGPRCRAESYLWGG